MTIASLECILSNFIDGPVDTYLIRMVVIVHCETLTVVHFLKNIKGIENPAFVDFIKNIETEETLVQVHDIESPSSETG